jgi:rhamnosyltransferase
MLLQIKNLTGSDIVAVVVSYQPDLHVLTSLINIIATQVTKIIVVDNGSDTNISEWNDKRENDAVELILLNENRGIAAAQNIGIQWARDKNAGFVLLMDQDSLPAHDMVLQLAQALSTQAMPAAAGPRYLDKRQNNPPPFLQIQGLSLKRCTCSTEDTVTSVDYLIASGCLIPMHVLNKVGGMREDLFIDYVDIEWGLRAKHHGYQSIGVCAAHMEHNLGDNPIKFFKRNIPLHSALRHYYHFRNAVLLYKDARIPLNWKIVDGWRLLLKYGFYTLFAKPHLKQWWMMTIGMWHGIIGKSGKYGE